MSFCIGEQQKLNDSFFLRKNGHSCFRSTDSVKINPLGGILVHFILLLCLKIRALHDISILLMLEEREILDHHKILTFSFKDWKMEVQNTENSFPSKRFRE